MMENVIVCQTRYPDPDELREYLRHQGYEARLVRSRSELLSGAWSPEYGKLFLEVNGVSDLLFLQTLRNAFPGLEIILIAPPQLGEIIRILGSDYRTIKDITHLSNIGKNQRSKP
jgi:hypothetical protein